MAKFDISEDLLEKLAKVLKEANLTEIEYEADGAHIRMSKAVEQVMVQQAPMQMAPVMAPPPATSASAPEATNVAASNGHTVTSPMVGTAYKGPEPTKPAFVKVGDTVKEGQTLLIIEAMKVMNPLPSPVSGTVTEIIFKEGGPVEFGQPLLVIE
ncbi:acetyl-CoA carboxylase biotin carboxyl carrier protein [Alphaproteobacteria bacterium]|jgi:acetyl-CoA carboxylase biotin carboxyl carrier protein|nr:acetyl-CoA carboxylase biotin carboxyl carrier protein [Alphaproteobacteria bacterium]